MKLRPDYADGYTNIALDLYRMGKVLARRAPVCEKALDLSPNNARALYYLALVERRDRTLR